MITDEQLDSFGEKLIKKLESGNSQEKLFLNLLEGIADRINNDKDAIICTCGDRGKGKTSLAVWAAIGLRQFNIKFNMSNIFYGSKDLKTAIRKMINETRNTFIFDEMIDHAYSRDAMSSVNKTVAKILTKSRKVNHVTFFCIPRFRNLDSTIRNDVVNFWLEVFWQSKAEDRHKKYALAALFRKDMNPLAQDPWGFDDTSYIRKRIFSAHDQLKLMRKIRSYVCPIQFPPLPLTLENKYKQLSIECLKDSGDKFINDVMSSTVQKKDKQIKFLRKKLEYYQKSEKNK